VDVPKYRPCERKDVVICRDTTHVLAPVHHAPGGSAKVLGLRQTKSVSPHHRHKLRPKYDGSELSVFGTGNPPKAKGSCLLGREGMGHGQDRAGRPRDAF
jgi:hypothetical protein